MGNLYSSIIILSILIYIAIAAIPATIAKDKGYDFLTFYLYGLFLFPISLIHLAFLPNKFEQAKKDEIYELIKSIASNMNINNEKEN